MTGPSKGNARPTRRRPSARPIGVARLRGRGPVTLCGTAVAVVFACAPIVLEAPDCRPTRTGIALPEVLVETSGVAVGVDDASVLWTHNDDGSELFAIDSTGEVRATWRVRPVLVDWEDIAAAPCEAHDSCLYFADTGDNPEQRPAGAIRIVRVSEPALPDPPAIGTAESPVLAGEPFPIRLPDGPRDIEALFVLPGERLHLVTKGRNHAITVYRYPPPLRPDTVTLEEVQRLTGGSTPIADQVTGASASADGRTVAIRTYQALEFFRTEADTLARVDDGLVNLRTLRESQGEAVGLGSDGLVVLTSEGGVFGAAASMNVMRCDV